MDQRLTLFVLAFTILFSACNNDQASKETGAISNSLNKELPGTWEAVSVKVIISTPDNTPDSSAVFEIKEEEWINRLGVRPVKTFYQKDNRYRQEFTALNDTIMSINRGMWNVFGDTLMMIEPTATYQYITTAKNGLIEFRALLDWDGDGEEDDEYTGVHRKISKYTD